MSKTETRADEQGALAAPEDVIRIMGDMNGAKLVDIMALQPPISAVEKASLWLEEPPRQG